MNAIGRKERVYYNLTLFPRNPDCSAGEGNALVNFDFLNCFTHSNGPIKGSLELAGIPGTRYQLGYNSMVTNELNCG